MAKSSSTANDGEIMQVGGNAGARLKAFVERIVRLEEEKKETGEDIKEVYSEAKGTGFDTKILRKVVKRFQMDPDKKREEDDLIDTYEVALAKSLGEMME
jgi:uncharacterized protein (UPF0335 family)